MNHYQNSNDPLQTMSRLQDSQNFKAKEGNSSIGYLYYVWVVLVIVLLLVQHVGVAQSGNWDSQQTVGTTGINDYGNGVIQMMDNTSAGCAGTAIHESTDLYDPTTDGVFSKCYQTYFGCPGQDEIGSDARGDGMAFSFSKCGFGVGGCGGGLGYANACPQMVTVEFDTWSSEGNAGFDLTYEGTGIDDQIAIHMNGNAATVGKVAGVSPGNLEDGLEHEVCMTYDPTSGIMDVDIDGNTVLSHTFITANRLENYFGAGGLVQTWSSGKFGATNPATVSDGADITDQVGGPLCAANVVVISHENGDTETDCGPIDITAFVAEPAGNTIDSVAYFVNGGKIGSVTSEPWTFSWNNPTVGGHALRAQAFFSPSGTNINSWDANITVTACPAVTALLIFDQTDVCDGETIRLSASPQNATYTYQWFLDGNPLGPATVGDSTRDVTVGGDYTVEIDANGPTDLSEVVGLTFTPISVADAGASDTICENTSINLAANAAGVGETGTWSGGLGAYSTDENDPTAVYTPSAGEISAGEVTLTWTIENGGICTPTSDVVTFTIDVIPSGAAAGNDQNICATSTTLSATAPVIGTGSWSGTASFDDVNSATGSVSGLSIGSNILTWTVSNGVCPASTDDVEIRVTGGITTALAGNKDTICENSTISLAANAVALGETGTWSGGLGGYSTDENDPMAVYTPTAGEITAGEVTLTWTIENGGICTPTSDNVTFTIDALPSTSAAGNDQNICATSTTLSATAPVVGTGVWTGAASFDGANTATSSVSGLSVGSNTLTWTVSNGVCPASTDDVEISVTGGITTANAGADDTLCENTTLTLNANAAALGETGSWSGGLGSYSTNINDPSAIYVAHTSELPSGSVTLTWTIDNGGLCPSSSDEVVFTFDALPSTADAGDDAAICVTSFDLNAQTPTVGQGVWTGGTFDDVSNAQTEVSGLSTGINTLTWTVSNGVCPASSDQVVIDVTGSMTEANAGVDQTLCENQTISLSANAVASGETGTWTGTGTFEAGINNPITDYTPSAEELQSGQIIVTWTIDNGGICPEDTDRVEVTLERLPSQSDAGVDQDVCEDSDVALSGSSLLTGETGKWSGGFGEFVPNANDPNATYVLDQSEVTAGSVVLRWTVQAGASCPSSQDDMIIQIEELPGTVDAGDYQMVEWGDEIFLNAIDPQVGEGVWTGGSGIFLPDATDPMATYEPLDTDVEVELTWTVTNGVCPSESDDVLIRIVKPLKIPNVFTPNGDGINDTWNISGLETYGSAILNVFNRWGNAVYTDIGSVEPWDGSFKGKELPVGTYYYVLQLNQETGPFEGYVELMK